MKRRINNRGSREKIELAKERQAMANRIIRSVEQDFNAFLNAHPELREKVMNGLLGTKDERV